MDPDQPAGLSTVAGHRAGVKRSRSSRIVPAFVLTDLFSTRKAMRLAVLWTAATSAAQFLVAGTDPATGARGAVGAAGSPEWVAHPASRRTARTERRSGLHIERSLHVGLLHSGVGEGRFPHDAFGWLAGAPLAV